MRKFKNIPTVIDGVKFDSKLEARYFEYLRTVYRRGDIILQPIFTLQDKFRYKGKGIRAITYVSDFRIESNVYDTKGLCTEVFKIKAKLFKFKYPELNLVIVKWDFRNKRWIES